MPAGALSIAAIVMPAASSPPGPFHLRDFGGRDFVLTLDTPAGYQDHDDSGDKVENYQPPDVPDERKAQDGCKESSNETGRAVARHFNRFIGRRARGPPGALHVPERVDGLDPGQHRKIVGRRRRRGRPLERSTVPRVAGQVEAALARADADIELGGLAENAAENDDGPDLRDQQQRLPARIRDVLQAPGHAHEAQLIKGHESEIKADEPAPEAGLAPSFVEGEPKGLGEPILVASERAEHDAADNDIVKMRDQEGAVMDLEIDRGHRQ